MKREEILNAIRTLSKSQGFYGRIYNAIVGNEEVLGYLESQNFKDTLDIVMFLECEF